MPRYHFHLRTPQALYLDHEGTPFADGAQAHEHATTVARELMRNRGARTRSWRLEVFEGDENERRFEVPFATVDATLEHLQPDLRKAIEQVSSRMASLFEAINAVKGTIYEVKATRARAKKAPYLASVRGVRVATTGTRARALGAHRTNPDRPGDH
jgi:hypothetical protein